MGVSEFDFVMDPEWQLTKKVEITSKKTDIFLM